MMKPCAGCELAGDAKPFVVTYADGKSATVSYCQTCANILRDRIMREGEFETIVAIRHVAKVAK